MTQTTGITLKNSMGGAMEPLRLAEPGLAKIYVCGVTVYDHCHLGHARSAVAFDMIVKHLRRRVGSALFVRNITDIDDKIIARAEKNGEDWRSLSSRMADSMREDFSALGCAPPDIEPKASDFIPEMIERIEALLAAGHAYAAEDGGVWFDGSSWDGVGALSGRKAQDLLPEARVAARAGKRGPSDFALWKPAKPNEPSWASPWGPGRPGWHIECSAMSQKLLGPSFDLHGGGEDLKFPHHECERCQSEPLSGRPLASQWLHNGFVLLAPDAPGGEAVEMHKSSGNARNIKELLAFHPGEAIRLWILTAHYRQPLLFSQKDIEAARRRLERLYGALDPAKALSPPLGSPDPEALTALDEDFNFPRALVRLEALAKLFKAEPDNRELASSLLATAECLGLGGLSLPAVLQWGAPGADAEQGARAQELLGARAAARAQRDWAAADRARQEIEALGYRVEDTPAGPELRRRAP